MHWSGGSAESTRQTSGFSFPDVSMKLTEKYHQMRSRQSRTTGFSSRDTSMNLKLMENDLTGGNIIKSSITTKQLRSQQGGRLASHFLPDVSMKFTENQSHWTKHRQTFDHDQTAAESTSQKMPSHFLNP